VPETTRGGCVGKPSGVHAAGCPAFRDRRVSGPARTLAFLAGAGASFQRRALVPAARRWRVLRRHLDRARAPCRRPVRSWVPATLTWVFRRAAAICTRRRPPCLRRDPGPIDAAGNRLTAAEPDGRRSLEAPVSWTRRLVFRGTSRSSREPMAVGPHDEREQAEGARARQVARGTHAKPSLLSLVEKVPGAQRNHGFGEDVASRAVAARAGAVCETRTGDGVKPWSSILVDRRQIRCAGPQSRYRVRTLVAT